MSRTKSSSRERVAAFRQRRRATGRVLVSTDLPGDLIAAVDQIKQERGVSSRTPIIEEALRFYIDKQQRA
jgi:metal-responsive CopG/Arc/MetJ family transcriptional regulator